MRTRRPMAPGCAGNQNSFTHRSTSPVRLNGPHHGRLTACTRADGSGLACIYTYGANLWLPLSSHSNDCSRQGLASAVLRLASAPPGFLRAVKCLSRLRLGGLFPRSKGTSGEDLQIGARFHVEFGGISSIERQADTIDLTTSLVTSLPEPRSIRSRCGSSLGVLSAIREATNG